MAIEIKKDGRIIATLSVLAVGILVLVFTKTITWAEGIAGLGLVLVPSVFGQQKPNDHDEEKTS